MPNVGSSKYARAMTSRCPSRVEALAAAQRAHKATNVVHCRYCGWWHVVGIGSPLERPSKPRKRR